MKEKLTFSLRDFEGKLHPIPNLEILPSPQNLPDTTLVQDGLTAISNIKMN